MQAASQTEAGQGGDWGEREGGGEDGLAWTVLVGGSWEFWFD